MRFVVIRHGQSTNNLLWEQTGSNVGRHHDPELTDLGHDQAKLLGDLIANNGLPWQITHLHSSLMTRAVQTAHPLAEALDLPLLGHLHAYEIGGPFIDADDGGRDPYPGAPASALLTLSDRLVLPATATEAGWFTGPVEAEGASADRARRLVAGLREQHDDGAVVGLVTHGAFFQDLLRAFLGIDSMTGWVIKHNTAVSLFEDSPEHGGVTAHQLDWMPHLTADLVSL